jgi:hypothetical protein
MIIFFYVDNDNNAKESDQESSDDLILKFLDQPLGSQDPTAFNMTIFGGPCSSYSRQSTFCDHFKFQ